MSKRGSRKRLRDTIEAYLFLLPHFIFFVIFVILPLIYGVIISFHDWKIIGEARFIGLENFVRVWEDSRFWDTLKNTVMFAAISVPLIVALGIALALLINKRFYGKLWALVAFVSPTFFGSIGVLLSWRWILGSQPQALAKYYLQKLGIDTPASWFSTSQIAWTWIIIITAWWIVGFSVLLYLGSLQRIPPEQYEAAKLDGANAWQQFTHITLPWIRNVMFFDVTRHVLLAFGLFDQVYMLTGGGPAGSTRTIVYYLYLVGFERQQLGRAAAISWYIFVVILAFSAIQLALLTKSIKSAEVE
ncbi:MAG TPA: sugar ABC transporter permease [Dictyoglomaceae bacterium]|nr:sugar ABC transporter permease [Dictyoglomaceae bacterium]HOL39311.1 sugar ABC transporter permease [Dictyoglomaceae bacterium]HOP95036.1 sugar ABC transporter permease [Dictyoglomaceae bacterium]HPP16007.1 sugar ABC transporter permease [Dictyoglomaceae bacterium]HPU42972.1 sugar ABC transporter permease [Dictyoglomaceae bacterium]